VALSNFSIFRASLLVKHRTKRTFSKFCHGNFPTNLVNLELQKPEFYVYSVQDRRILNIELVSINMEYCLRWG
jgi:hypothetical protein